jgi:hypothetical protein
MIFQMGSKLKENSGRWTTAKDTPQPKGLTLIPENTEGGKKKKIVNPKNCVSEAIVAIGDFK